jgi:hypothetical protein
MASVRVVDSFLERMSLAVRQAGVITTALVGRVENEGKALLTSTEGSTEMVTSEVWEHRTRPTGVTSDATAPGASTSTGGSSRTVRWRWASAKGR